MLRRVVLLSLATTLTRMAFAGPPYLSDDPQPTDTGHYEIYFFNTGAAGSGAIQRSEGIDFNYGGAPDVQLTVTLPINSTVAAGGETHWGLGNAQLAAKYRILHQDDTGWDVAIFPRLFLSSSSSRFGEAHPSLLLPVWIEHDWASGWSTFGGGGCAVNPGADSKNFCLAGWVVTHQASAQLQFGLELFHQTADVKAGSGTTSAGVGLKWDASAKIHCLAYVGPGLENVGPNPRYNWYTSILLTL